jgi:hypothetical protein
MDIVNFYQSAGLGDPAAAKADVWEKMKGAAGGESGVWENDGPSLGGTGLTGPSAPGKMSREPSQEGAQLQQGNSKFHNPVSPAISVPSSGWPMFVRVAAR